MNIPDAELSAPHSPLHGLRVLDLSRGTAGPRLTGLLADYGADVIWVEPPGGDPWRDMLRVEYSVFNRGKRSVALDLKSDSGLKEFFELASTADVVTHSFAPGVADRHGIGWGHLHARFPHLIYSHISGFGEGAAPGIPGYEAIVHALIGTMAEQVGFRDPPVYEALPFASIGAAYLAAIGVLASLFRRLEDGHGRKVETSLYDGAAAHMIAWGVRGDDHPADFKDIIGERRSVIRNFECSDGEYISVHTGAVGAVGRLMRLLKLEDKFALRQDGLDHRDMATPEELEVLNKDIPEIFQGRPRAYWIDALLKADVAVTPAFYPGQVYDEPQTRHNKMVVQIDDPVLGLIEQIGLGIDFGTTPGHIRGPAPVIGADQGGTFHEGPRWTPDVLSNAPDESPLLAGVHVLDLGVYYAGPFSSRLLADLGADVIKLETLRGDGLRGRDAAFNSGQAGKRAISADLKTTKGNAIARSLVEWADVVHHNMRPGAAERLGVGFADVHQMNASAVYMHSPGWGASGPCSAWQSFAPLMSVYAGIAFEVAGRFNPPLFPLGNEDTGNGFLGAIALLGALLDRRRTGEGQFIQNPQLNAALLHTAHMVRTADGEVLGAGRLDPLGLGISAFDRLYETTDGWVCIVAKTPVQVSGIERALSCTLPHGAELLSEIAPSDADADTADVIASTLHGMKTTDALNAFHLEGVPAVEPIGLNGFSFMRDPENIRLRRTAVTKDRDGTMVRDMDLLVRISNTQIPTHRLAPHLGEHTDGILSELGYSREDIADLRANHIVA